MPVIVNGDGWYWMKYWSGSYHYFLSWLWNSFASLDISAAKFMLYSCYLNYCIAFGFIVNCLQILLNCVALIVTISIEVLESGCYPIRFINTEIHFLSFVHKFNRMWLMCLHWDISFFCSSISGFEPGNSQLGDFVV